tara:strand:+ start:2035 stop:2406 length:372 start_codon:yes stop_codon:yes gene_type:complete
MNVNVWLGCGRLTKDAEGSVTKKGTSMTKFRMAVNDRRNDDTLFLNVLCFGKMAESLEQHLIKGRLVSVQGKIKVDEYEDKNGNPRNSVCVMADEISLGPQKGGTETTSEATGTSEVAETAPF